MALGLSVAMQITMTTFMVLGPSRDTGFIDQLTEYGKTLTRPEHDLFIYVVGALVAVVAAWVMVWWWRHKLALCEVSQAAGPMTSSALLAGLLAATSATVYALLLSSGWSRDFRSASSGLRLATSGSDAVSLLLPCVIALACAAVDLECGFGQPTASASRFEPWRLRLGKVLRYAIPVFVILVVGVPPGTWRHLAGQFFLIDRGLHLNFFVMGPALSFAHGKAFGTEIYSQYGIGWPLLASLPYRFSALTYGNLVGLEIVYGCVYYVALFCLLRRCFQEEIWAAIAVVLAIYWQIFSGMNSYETIWLAPSSTMMRHPMDVWFFLALVMHQRSGKICWAALAGLAGALGVFFETETGAYLLATFLIYSVLQAGVAAGERRAGGAKGWLLPPLAFYSAVIVALLPLLFYASRGTLFTRAFWHGWIEALVMYAAYGVGALPIAEVPDAPLLTFMVMVSVYLAVFAYASIKGLHGNASQGDALLATLAAYGLALLLLFVNRSHPFNLCHAAIPFAVVLTALMARCHKVLASPLRCSFLPYAMAGGLVLLLLAKPQFQRYPSFLAAIFTKAPTGGLSLKSAPADLSGLPPDAEGLVREFNNITSVIHIFAPDGKGVAILDPYDTLIYYGANASPWSRYASLFHMALTKESLDGIRNELLIRSPSYVVIRGQNATRPLNWDFAWAPLYQAVTNRYVLRPTVDPFEIWQRANPR